LTCIYDPNICVLDGKSERVHVLAEECQACIAIGVEALDNTIQQLLTGHISLAKLKVLTAGTTSFLEVFRVVEKNAQSAVFKVPESGVKDVNRTTVLQKVMRWRMIEQRNLEGMCRLVSHFVAACGGVQSGWLRITYFWCQFLPCCVECRRSLAMRILSVRPSVCQMHDL